MPLTWLTFYLLAIFNFPKEYKFCVSSRVSSKAFLMYFILASIWQNSKKLEWAQAFFFLNGSNSLAHHTLMNCSNVNHFTEFQQPLRKVHSLKHPSHLCWAVQAPELPYRLQHQSFSWSLPVLLLSSTIGSWKWISTAHCLQLLRNSHTFSSAVTFQGTLQTRFTSLGTNNSSDVEIFKEHYKFKLSREILF